MNPFTSLKMLGAVLKDLAAFEDKKVITLQVPEATTTADLTEYGLGHVKIVESGGTLQITKID